jgi:hypothetical protein
MCCLLLSDAHLWYLIMHTERLPTCFCLQELDEARSLDDAARAHRTFLSALDRQAGKAGVGQGGSGGTWKHLMTAVLKALDQVGRHDWVITMHRVSRHGSSSCILHGSCHHTHDAEPGGLALHPEFEAAALHAEGRWIRGHMPCFMRPPPIQATDPSACQKGT